MHTPPKPMKPLTGLTSTAASDETDDTDGRTNENTKTRNDDEQQNGTRAAAIPLFVVFFWFVNVKNASIVWLEQANILRI